ncbi:MAG: metalloregulator ArsR/SmtB family transcription factor [Pseudomonadota bacterium]
MNTLDTTFAALGNHSRRAILSRLCDGEIALSELASPFDMTQTAVTKHVNILRDAGLVDIEKRGRTRYCRLSAKPMKEASDWLQSYQAYWDDTLGALARYIEKKP